MFFSRELLLGVVKLVKRFPTIYDVYTLLLT